MSKFTDLSDDTLKHLQLLYDEYQQVLVVADAQASAGKLTSKRDSNAAEKVINSQHSVYLTELGKACGEAVGYTEGQFTANLRAAWQLALQVRERIEGEAPDEQVFGRLIKSVHDSLTGGPGVDWKGQPVLLAAGQALADAKLTPGELSKRVAMEPQPLASSEQPYVVTTARKSTAKPGKFEAAVVKLVEGRAADSVTVHGRTATQTVKTAQDLALHALNSGLDLGDAAKELARDTKERKRARRASRSR